MEALGINFGYFLVQVVNFAIIFVVLRQWAYKPMVNVLAERRERIAQGLEDARIAAEARANAEQEAEKILSDARAKAAEEAREITARAEAQLKDVSAAAEAQAAKIKEAAQVDAQAARDQALSEVRGQVAALSIAAAQKLVGEALDEKRQRALIDEFFSGVKSGKVNVVQGASVSGDNAVVTSALPLTDAEQGTVKSEVLAKLGGGEVEFKVDPAILGGLVVRVGDKILDDSVAGKLGAMRQTLR